MDLFDRCDPDLWPYTFSCKDEQDETTPILAARGYCDDNFTFTSETADMKDMSRREKTLAVFERSKDKLLNASDFSLVTQLGMEASKCSISILNADPSIAANPPTVSIVSWSFAKHGPDLQQVPIHFHFCMDEDADVSDEHLQLAAELTYTDSDKNLGVHSDLPGNTHKMKEITVSKIHGRTDELRLYRVRYEKALIIATNSLLTTVASYAPLLIGFDSQDLMKIDSTLLRRTSKQLGFAASDSKLLVSVNQKQLGHGLKMHSAAHLAALARELRVVLNDPTELGAIPRARLQAFANGEPETTANYVRNAIQLLARFGFYVRDERSNLVSRMLDSVAVQNYSHRIIGSPKCTVTSSVLGKGDDNLQRLAIGGPVERAIRLTVANYVEANGTAPTSRELMSTKFWNNAAKPKRIAAKTLAKAATEAIKDIRTDSTNLRVTYEWRVSPGDDDPVTSNNWKKIEAAPVQGSDWMQSDALDMTLQDYLRTSRLDWNDQDDRRILEVLTANCCPIIVSTDGGHIIVEGEKSRTAAALVLCASDLRLVGEDPTWIHNECIPVLARITLLPACIGSSDADSGHGEALAVNQIGETIPDDAPAIIITDSESVRSKYLTIRDKTAPSNRTYLRNTFGGISECLTVAIADSIDRWQPPAVPNETIALIAESLKAQISDDPEKPWKEKSWDGHPISSNLQGCLPSAQVRLLQGQQISLHHSLHVDGIGKPTGG